MATPTTTAMKKAPNEIPPISVFSGRVIAGNDAVLIVDVEGSGDISVGDRVGREGITLWITLAKGAAWIMAEHSTTESRNCCKFRTSVPAKRQTTLVRLQGNKLTGSERQRLIIANILAYELC